MARASSLPVIALTASAVACVALGSRPAAGALLEEPPKLTTFKLDDPALARLTLLDAFRDAAVDSESGRRHYVAGQWGRWRGEPWWKLAWQNVEHTEDTTSELAPLHDHAAEDGISITIGPASDMAGASGAGLFGFDTVAGTPAPFRLPTGAAEAKPSWLDRLDPSYAPAVLATTGATTFKSNGFDTLWSLPPTKPIPNWRCRRRPVTIARYGGETDQFPIVRCDGSVAPQAFDKLSIMARLTDAARPGDLLPDEPDQASLQKGEWAPGVHLVHPRLLWVIQRVADAFPWRAIYVFSGYRRPHDGEGRAKPGSHHSMHSEARAMDINVLGIPNTALFQFCRTLDDVGCGFYPNSKFVHLDVRHPGSGHPLWIDASGPGEPSRYVDSWPGVVESGALAWDPAGAKQSHGPGSEADCTRRGP